MLEDLWRLFERRVFSVASRDGLFNPYRDAHPEADQPRAPRLRRANLRAFLECYPQRPRVLLVGEASGPWGCRFSGVPFTSERQLARGELPFPGQATSTASVPHAERSASVFWGVLLPHFPRFFVWNSVPLHPHPPGSPFSLRRPSPSELQLFREVLAGVIACLAPEQIISVGRIAERAVRELGVEPLYVRHPSHGGPQLFRAGIARALGPEQRMKEEV